MLQKLLNLPLLAWNLRYQEKAGTTRSTIENIKIIRLNTRFQNVIKEKSKNKQTNILWLWGPMVIVEESSVFHVEAEFKWMSFNQ